MEQSELNNECVRVLHVPGEENKASRFNNLVSNLQAKWLWTMIAVCSALALDRTAALVSLIDA